MKLRFSFSFWFFLYPIRWFTIRKKETFICRDVRRTERRWQRKFTRIALLMRLPHRREAKKKGEIKVLVLSNSSRKLIFSFYFLWLPSVVFLLVLCRQEILSHLFKYIRMDGWMDGWMGEHWTNVCHLVRWLYVDYRSCCCSSTANTLSCTSDLESKKEIETNIGTIDDIASRRLFSCLYIHQLRCCCGLFHYKRRHANHFLVHVLLLNTTYK